jgi:hypothetical protein
MSKLQNALILLLIVAGVTALTSGGYRDYGPYLVPAEQADAPTPTIAPTPTPTPMPEPAPEPEPTPHSPVEGYAAQALGTLQIYGYNPYDAKQVGKRVADGITASGEPAIPGETCAMSRDVPFGTLIYIDGLGTYRVNDRGVGKGVVDIAAATNAECYKITRKAQVWILEGY